MSLRVAGTDPGTSSLDVIVLEDGVVLDQCRFTPDELRADVAAPVRWLERRGPFALVAGPSGYGLPLLRAADTTGPFGWASGGAWDGEVAYLLSPLTKRDLFGGGVGSVPDAEAGRRRYREDLLRTVAGLRAVTPFEVVVLSGRLLETETAFVTE